MATNLSKHQQNSARTRERLVDAAVALYGTRSIDAVSLREISAAAGQKNPNALQYHFGDRDGLLQAIIDKHATRVDAIRSTYLQRAREEHWPAAEAVARCLVMPIIDYVDSEPDGLYFVRVISQIAAVHQDGLGDSPTSGLNLPKPKALAELIQQATANLRRAEAQRRTYLIVDVTFHTIADICRASERLPEKSPIADRQAMVGQLLAMIQAFLATQGAN